MVFLGNVALEASTLVGLGSAGGDAYSFGPSISWPAFDLGRVRARIQAADARAESQLARYEQTVLVALEETENALLDFGRQQARRDFLRAAAGASEKAAALARQRFEEGVSDFLTVLDAERRLLEDQDRLAQSETDTAIALVAVYKALGGGVGDGEPGCESGFLTVSDLGWMEGFSDLPSFHVEDGKSILIRWVPSSVCKPYLTGWMVPILRSGNSLPPIARIAPPFWWAVPTLPG